MRSQAIRNTISSYAGVALGYLNLILLFPNFFTTEQFGLIQLLISIAEVYALVSAAGLANSINRFFPFYKSEDKIHNGFLTYIFLISFSGFSIATITYLLFRPLIIDAYIQKSGMFVDYFFILIPFALFTMMFNVFEVVARVIFKTSFSTFVREVVLRLLTTAGIILYITNILSFSNFVIYYVAIYFIIAAAILIQIIISREFSFRLSFRHLQKNRLKEMLSYGGYTLISGAAIQTGLRIPALMLGAMVGLSMVGIYNLYFYIASIIYVPMRSMSRIAVAVISTAWKDNDLQKIRDIYRRASLIQFIFGTLIYIGIIINRENLFYFIKNPEYTVNFLFFPVIGLGILIDVVAGLHSEIISYSKKFRYDSLFNIILLAVSITGNLILIPIMGGIGAAFGFLLAYFTFNFLKWLFLYRTYDLQPLDYKQLIIMLLGGAAFLIGEYIPVLSNIFLDIMFRSGLVTLVYMTGILIFRISPDLNERYSVYKGKLFRK
ncbi:MAG: oligosaccharide flippase family protein [Ignavibacteria bacterium]|nr:oligosaccharide flippase family protein [Ignavibacteria bacterium]